jgi:large subunit ribosomal protein L35
MPKQKTYKAFRKRFKITAHGKVKHKRAGGSHLMSSKNAKRRRRLAKLKLISPTMAKKYKVRM